jgi:hypothetical protein
MSKSKTSCREPDEKKISTPDRCLSRVELGKRLFLGGYDNRPVFGRITIQFDGCGIFYDAD